MALNLCYVFRVIPNSLRYIYPMKSHGMQTRTNTTNALCEEHIAH